MTESKTLYTILLVVSIVVGILLLYGLYKLWMRFRPKLLTPPTYWPAKGEYDWACKQSGKILSWPMDHLGFANDAWIINLWLLSHLLMFFTMPIALLYWLIKSLPNHWLWYRLSHRKRNMR